MIFRRLFRRSPERFEPQKEKIDYSQPGLVDLEIKKPVIVKGDALEMAKRIKAEKVEAGRHALKWAELCSVEKLKAKGRALDAAKLCSVEKLKAGTVALENAELCSVEKLKAGKDALEFAKLCSVGELEAGGDALGWAKKCLITKGVKAKEIGEKSRGVVILGEARGQIFPSVILMEGKLEKEKPEEVERFFKDELKKSQEGKESIYDYLSYFNWEGKTLEKGAETLREKYEKIKDKKELLNEHYFYYLIDDNLKREELFSGSEKLRKVERNNLWRLDFSYLPQFEKVKNYLSLISLKDWVKLGEYAEFLDFDNKRIENIKQEFEKFNFEEIIKNPKKFDAWKTARHIKHLKRQGMEIDPQKSEKEFKKERNSKINSAIREYILTSPKENNLAYLEKIGWEGEINEDILFAARLHKALAKKGRESHKNLLEKIMKGEDPRDFWENELWLKEMQDKIDTKKWLAHKQKEYTPIVEKDYSASLEKSRAEQLQEIVKHFKEIGIEIKPEIDEIEEVFSKRQKEIPSDVGKDIKTHIQAYQSLSGIEKSPLPKKIILETEENPLKTIQMGERVVGSCLRIGGGDEESAVCNAADINKRIVWAKDEKGEILGRVLLTITEGGKLADFRVYNNDPRLDLKSCYKNFIFEFAKDLKTEVASKEKL